MVDTILLHGDLAVLFNVELLEESFQVPLFTLLFCPLEDIIWGTLEVQVHVSIRDFTS